MFRLAPKLLWQQSQETPAALPRTSAANAVAQASASSAIRAPLKCMPAEVFREGKAVEHMVREIVADLLSEPALKRNVGNGRQHTFATLCSGSEMPSVAIHIAESVWASEGIHHTFKQVYM